MTTQEGATTLTRGQKSAEAEERRLLLEEARKKLARYIVENGLKSTRQRDLIADTFLAQDGHLNVDELLERVRVLDPKISAATVYRTMKLLTDSGLAHARQFGDGQTRYEGAFGRDHHDHLICTQCNAIFEFEDERIEQLQNEVAKAHNFQVTMHKLELYGLCIDCQAEERSSQETTG